MKKKNKSNLQKVGLSASLGLELISGIAVGVIMGYYLDKWFNTKPIFMVILMFLGFMSGLLNLYRRVKNLEKID